MVIGHHLIFTGYAQWLPNDPRGSTSASIRNRVLEELGTLHHGRKRVQPAAAKIRSFYARAEGLLQHPRIEFGADQREAIAGAFAKLIAERPYRVWACAILPEHVHLLVRRHRDRAEEMIRRFQEASRAAMLTRPEVPEDHPVWGGPGWKVFQESREDVLRTIRYIERNPVPYGLPVQKWGFVTPYDNWPWRKQR